MRIMPSRGLAQCHRIPTLRPFAALTAPGDGAFWGDDE